MSFIVIFIFILALFIPASQSQYSPEDYLAPHNAARAEVNVGPLEWDEHVAAYARDYANRRAGDCRLTPSSGQYGENLGWGIRDLRPADAVGMWVNEKRNYDYDSNSCQGGDCSHYTQVVWRNSVRLGCATMRCNAGGTIAICSYDPPGNVEGQRPYILSDTGSIYNI
ncbi:hypothetical protein MKX03_025836 [Papaver bracteatum]|nr:hypothetical protein MKX03_025836 [Papaver bracteatum]